MTMTDNQRLAAARRLIDVAGADDSETVHDYGIGYAPGNSGYHTDVWVSGDWNERQVWNADEHRWVTVSDMPKRLASALERLGVNVEWHDTVDRCADCARLIGTEPTSYGWLPQYVITDDGEYVCRDCVLTDAETFLAEHYANHADRAVTWLSVSELAEYGWADALPDDYDAEHGFHPGQTDTPDSVLTRWRDVTPDADTYDWLFVITDKGQFDIRYRLMVREVTA